MAVLIPAGEEVPETPSLRTNLVISGSGECLESYGIGCLEIDEPESSFAIIAVTVVDGKVLVVLPEESWARRRVDRRLPSGALKKAVGLKVTSCTLGDRTAPSREPDLSVWIGLLEPSFESAVTYDSELPEIDFPGEAEQQLVPYAPALVAVCQDHFAFVTAESQVDGPPGLQHPMAEMELRLGALEQMLSEMRQDLRPPQMMAPTSKAAANPRPSALRKPASARAQSSELPQNLDPAVAQQALQSGVTPEVLAEMSNIVGPAGGDKGRKAKSSGKALDATDGEESSEEEEGDAGLVDNSDPLRAAVLQLTKLVTHMSEDKVRKKDRGLESLLDKAEGHGLGKDSGGYSRSKAAALRELQKTLRSKPSLIYGALEQRLAEDWEDASIQPGISSSSVSARGWLEHRSRIQAFPASIRAGWALAGIWDCLRGGRNDEARARAALALAQLDQQSCDRGSYLLAAEVSLEAPPPYASFSAHLAPEVWELPHSRLLDPRWVELMMHRLRELSDYQEKKMKLSGARHQTVEDVEKPPKNPKPKPSPKGGGKGKEKGPGRVESDPPAAA